MENKTSENIMNHLTEPNAQPTKQNNSLIIILSILLPLSVSITGFFAYQTQMLVKELTLLKSSPTPLSVDESLVDPTEDWKTYSNEKFSFRYPDTVSIAGSGNNQTLLVGGLKVNINLQGPYQWGEGISKSEIDNLYIKSFQYPDKPEIGMYPDSAVIFSVEFDSVSEKANYKKQTDILDQILTTFKFAESGMASDWKTYTDSKQRFSIKYPSTWRIISGDFFGTGPKEIGEDILWAVNTFDINTNSISKVIDDLGKQFPDRMQTINKIKVGGINASQVITTTPTMADWYLETIIFEDADTIFTVSNGAIKDSKLQKMVGVPSGTVFKDFYSSFVLVN